MRKTVALSMFCLGLGSVQAAEQDIVIVNRGETLPDVAKRCGSTTEDLMRSNGLLKPYKIYIGQPLIYHKNTVKRVKKDYYAEESASAKTIESEAQTSLSQSHQRELKRTGKHFSWPVKGKVISTFGKKGQGLRNDGINIEVKFQTPVCAAEDGLVVYAGNEIRGFGNVLLIKHAGDWMSFYAHNDTLSVKNGDKVKRGQVIAHSGNTGQADTPQLHFQLRHNAKPVDPLEHLK